MTLLSSGVPLLQKQHGILKKRVIFRDTLILRVIKEIESEISNLFTDQTSKEQVNKVVCDISNILTESAGSCDLIKTFKIKNCNCMKEKYDQRVWFNADCKMLRENYLKAKYNYRCDKCNENVTRIRKCYQN